MSDHEGDREVLNVLRENGSDLSRPHRITHYFYFQTKTSAKAAARQLAMEGNSIDRVEPSAASPWWKRFLGVGEWVCMIENVVVPTEEMIFEMTDRFNEIAALHLGQYDGWETAIVR